jgi:protein-disulfide isomerase
MPQDSDTAVVQKKKFELNPSVAILLSGVLIAAAIVFVNVYPGQPVVNGAEPTAEITISPVSESDHMVGSPDAPIMLVEYSDFQCPFCARIHPDLKKVVEESEGQVAWVYRHYPLDSIHPEATPAALASECIAKQLGNEGFWKFADAMFADQSKMGAAHYVALAGQLGANVQQFSACVQNKEFGELVSNQAGEAQSSGASGTPFTVVLADGKALGVIPGALPYDQIKAVIKAVQERQ